MNNVQLIKELSLRCAAGTEAIPAQETASNYGMQYQDWDEREATFFSRSPKSLRPTLDLRSCRINAISSADLVTTSRIRLISSEFLVTRSRSSSIPSLFLPTCSYVLSNLALMLGMSSRIGLNSLRMASISAPTSVQLILSAFLARFFMNNMVMQRKFFVKQKGCHRFYKKAEN